MHIELDEGCVTNAAEAVDLAGLDDENVTCSGFEFLSVDGPETAALPHELDFVVRMTMGAWTTPREGAEEEHGHVHVAVVGANEVVRAALKGQVLLANAVHPADAPMEVLQRTASGRDRKIHRVAEQ
jgi:voltage-gated potassium channel Kch